MYFILFPPIFYYIFLYIIYIYIIIYIILFCFSPFFNNRTETGITAPFRKLIWKRRWRKNLIKALKSLKSKWIPDNVSAAWRKENTGGVKKEIHIITFIYIYIYSYHSSRGSSVSDARGGRKLLAKVDLISKKWKLKAQAWALGRCRILHLAKYLFCRDYDSLNVYCDNIICQRCAIAAHANHRIAMASNIAEWLLASVSKGYIFYVFHIYVEDQTGTKIPAPHF